MTDQHYRLIPSIAKQSGMEAKAFIEKFLGAAGGDISAAARKVGVATGTFRAEMIRCGIPTPKRVGPGPGAAKTVLAFGVSDTITGHLRRLDSTLTYATVQARLNNGMPPERAFTTPVQKENGRVKAKKIESDLELYLVKQVGNIGGEIRKVAWVGRRGAPDRLIMHGGRCVWVELKAPTRKQEADPHQAREHERMREHGGCDVRVLNSYEDIAKLILELQTWRSTNHATTSGQ